MESNEKEDASITLNKLRWVFSQGFFAVINGPTDRGIKAGVCGRVAYYESADDIDDAIDFLHGTISSRLAIEKYYRDNLDAMHDWLFEFYPDAVVDLDNADGDFDKIVGVLKAVYLKTPNSDSVRKGGFHLLQKVVLGWAV